MTTIKHKIPAKTRAAVRRGAKLLDKTYGKKWRRLIRKRSLDLSEPSYRIGSCGCILAQVDYHRPGIGDSERRGSYGGAVVDLGIGPGRPPLTTSTWARPQAHTTTTC